MPPKNASNPASSSDKSEQEKEEERKFMAQYCDDGWGLIHSTLEVAMRGMGNHHDFHSHDLEIARAHKYISDLLAKYPMEKKRTHR
jgi:hypothetical protein